MQNKTTREPNKSMLAVGRLGEGVPPPPAAQDEGVSCAAFSALPFCRLVYSRSHDAVIRVYDEAGNVIETHEHAGDFKEW